MKAMISWIVMVWTMAPFAATTAFGQCTGDCGGDGSVTVDEVITGLGIALGNSSLEQCPIFDASGDASVTVDEVVTALNNALNGCPTTQATPTPTPTATPTPTIGDVFVDPRLLGTFSGPGINGFTGAVQTVRLRIEIVGGEIIVTDLNANLYTSGTTRTVTALGPSTLIYMSAEGARFETLQLGPQANGDPAGTYADITTGVPPTGVSISFVLMRET